MSERKVLNKYYPPDFDPTKIPKLRLPKNRNFGIRLMAPFNMRCNTCGEYIYKGKKFNSQKETVEDKNYLGLHIFRFYIKCPQCIAVIAFRTDPETTDYVLEAGATRNFEALRTAELLAIKEQKEKEEELKNNPMKVLENRSLKSQQEIEAIENLEELYQIKKKQNNSDIHEILKDVEKPVEPTTTAEELEKRQAEEDERFIRSQFPRVRRLAADTAEAVDKVEETKKPKLEKKGQKTSNNNRCQKDLLKSIKIVKSAPRKEDPVSSSESAAGSSLVAGETKSLGLLVGYSDDSDQSDSS